MRALLLFAPLLLAATPYGDTEGSVGAGEYMAQMEQWFTEVDMDLSNSLDPRENGWLYWKRRKANGRQRFGLFDANGDGMWNEAEMLAGTVGRPANPQPTVAPTTPIGEIRPATREQGQAAWQSMQRHRDRNVDYALEMAGLESDPRKARAPRGPVSPEHFRKRALFLFYERDKNRNGRLERAEYVRDGLFK